jgi:hypothetical protein
VEGKGGVIPFSTWKPLLGDVLTCAKLHRIPYRWIAPGVSQAFLTETAENGLAARVIRESMDDMMRHFFFTRERQGALASTKSLALKFRGHPQHHQGAWHWQGTP